MPHFRLSLSLFLFLCLFSLFGCGGDPNLGQVPAKVIIKVDGAVIENAAVVFLDGTGNTCTARTDKNGVAVMRASISAGNNKMVEVKGVVPGEYKVSVSKSIPNLTPDPKDPSVMTIGSIDYIVPERYSKHSSSGLTATVKKGDKNEFTFELTTQ